MDGNNFGDSNLNSGFGGGSYSGSQYNSPLGTDGQPTTPPPVYEQQNYNQTDYGYGQPTTPPPVGGQQGYNQGAYGQPTTPPPIGVPPFTDSQGDEYYMEQQYYEPVYDGKPAMILAFGIVSICCCAPFGIASIVMYLIGKDSFPEDKKGMATAGFICSIVGLSMRVRFFVLAFILGMIGAI